MKKLGKIFAVTFLSLSIMTSCEKRVSKDDLPISVIKDVFKQDEMTLSFDGEIIIDEETTLKSGKIYICENAKNDIVEYMDLDLLSNNLDSKIVVFSDKSNSYIKQTNAKVVVDKRFASSEYYFVDNYQKLSNESMIGEVINENSLNLVDLLENLNGYLNETLYPFINNLVNYSKVYINDIIYGIIDNIFDVTENSNSYTGYLNFEKLINILSSCNNNTVQGIVDLFLGNGKFNKFTTALKNVLNTNLEKYLKNLSKNGIDIIDFIDKTNTLLSSTLGININDILGFDLLESLKNADNQKLTIKEYINSFDENFGVDFDEKINEYENNKVGVIFDDVILKDIKSGLNDLKIGGTVLKTGKLESLMINGKNGDNDINLKLEFTKYEYDVNEINQIRDKLDIKFTKNNVNDIDLIEMGQQYIASNNFDENNNLESIELKLNKEEYWYLSNAPEYKFLFDKIDSITITTDCNDFEIVNVNIPFMYTNKDDDSLYYSSFEILYDYKKDNYLRQDTHHIYQGTGATSTIGSGCEAIKVTTNSCTICGKSIFKEEYGRHGNSGEEQYFELLGDTCLDGFNVYYKCVFCNELVVLNTFYDHSVNFGKQFDISSCGYRWSKINLSHCLCGEEFAYSLYSINENDYTLERDYVLYGYNDTYYLNNGNRIEVIFRKGKKCSIQIKIYGENNNVLYSDGYELKKEMIVISAHSY